MQLQAALGAIASGAVPATMQQQLATLWDKYAEPLMQALTVRQGERAEKEIADITAILTELQTSILRELDEPQVEQLTLFSTPEREQFERNMNSLKVRAAQIPQEIEQETSLIRKRFENPTARLFPLAVTFLVPQKLIRP